jgi:hypothetical protein
VDDMTRLLREMAREARGGCCGRGRGAGDERDEEEEEDDDESVFVFLPPGPRHNAYSFEEGYRHWLGRAGGERGCWIEQDEVDIDATPLAAATMADPDDGLRLWDIGVKRSISRSWF